MTAEAEVAEALARRAEIKWECAVLDAARRTRETAAKRRTSAAWDARFRAARKDLIRAALGEPS